MGYKEVRDAINSVIDTNLTAVTNTSYTVHDRIPENITDSQGYSIIIMPDGGSFSIQSSSQYMETQTWFVDIYSPNAGTSYRSEQEDRLYDYADKLVTIFKNRRVLDSINSVSGIDIASIQFNDGDYPINSQVYKYHFRVTLRVHYSRSRVC
jgi:hypothetical protein